MCDLSRGMDGPPRSSQDWANLHLYCILFDLDIEMCCLRCMAMTIVGKCRTLIYQLPERSWSSDDSFKSVACSSLAEGGCKQASSITLP